MHPFANTSPIACFVTGTDTEIGKTLISSALLLFWQQEGLRTLGLKPIAAGAAWCDEAWHNEDVDTLAACSTEQAPLELRTPYLMQTPVAPHIAAELEGLRISSRVIVTRFEQLHTAAQAVVVEGVGGFRVPLNDAEDTADLAVSLNLPVVMVVGLRLGCINQALLTHEAIVARGLSVAGWVANHGATEMAHGPANVDAIRQRIEAPLLGVVPPLSGHDALTRARDAVTHLDGAALRQAFNRS